MSKTDRDRLWEKVSEGMAKRFERKAEWNIKGGDRRKEDRSKLLGEKDRREKKR